MAQTLRGRSIRLKVRIREIKESLDGLAEKNEDIEHGYVSRCLEDASTALALAVARLAEERLA